MCPRLKHKMLNSLRFNLLLILLLTCSGCGAILGYPRNDIRFLPIKRQFIADAGHFGVQTNGKEVSIAFGDVTSGPKILGLLAVHGRKDNDDAYCGSYTNKKTRYLNGLGKVVFGKKFVKRFIIINEDFKDAPLGALESLVYHELGHCLLDREHDNNDPIMGSFEYDGTSEFRYFQLREFFTKNYNNSPNQIQVLRSLPPSHSTSLVYQVSYSAFGETIEHKLYQNTDTGEFFKVEE